MSAGQQGNPASAWDGRRAELARLAAEFPGYLFWYVPVACGPDLWCWRPAGGTAADSRRAGSAAAVREALGGTETP